LVQEDSAPRPHLTQIPTDPQRGTQPAVETAVAPSEFQCIDDDRRDHQPHDDTTASTTPLSPLHLSPNASLLPTDPQSCRVDPQPCRVNLNALERKISSIGEKIDRLLLNDDNRHAAPLPVLPPPGPPVSSSNPTNPVTNTPGRTDLDALIAKVRRSLREDFLHLPATADPASDLPPVDMDALERKI